MKIYENIRQDKKFIVCSFYTSGEYYEGVFLDKLFPSLKKYDLPYHVEEIESLGAWQLNSGLKSLFVEKMLIAYTKEIGGKAGLISTSLRKVV